MRPASHVTFEDLAKALRDRSRYPPGFVWCFSMPAHSVEALAYWLRYHEPLPLCSPARAKRLMHICISGADRMPLLTWHTLFYVGRPIYRTNEPTAVQVADALDAWLKLHEDEQ